MIWRALVVLIMITLLPLSAHANNAWTRRDTQRELINLTLQFIDYKQTRYALDRGWEERNPILGKSPSVEKLTAFFITTVALHALISRALPRRYRTGWQNVTIIMQGANVVRGRSLGLRVEW